MTLVVARPFLLNLIPRLPRQPGVYGKQGTRGEAKRGEKWSKEQADMIKGEWTKYIEKTTQG
jgi:hypothetical protein